LIGLANSKATWKNIERITQRVELIEALMFYERRPWSNDGEDDEAAGRLLGEGGRMGRKRVCGCHQ
jgi:hypothetical protein